MYDVLTPVVLATGGSSTSLPTWMGNVTFTDITDTAEAIGGAVVPVIIAVLGVVIGIKLLKKFANKIG